MGVPDEASRLRILKVLTSKLRSRPRRYAPAVRTRASLLKPPSSWHCFCASESALLLDRAGSAAILTWQRLRGAHPDLSGPTCRR